MGRTNLKGVRVGKQVFLEYVYNNKSRQAMWKIKCDCGNIRIACGATIMFKKNPTLSCVFCMNKKHGYSPRGKEHYLYRAWHSMKTRCYNENTHYYKRYGGRGIKVFKEWYDFIPFKDYVEKNLGKRPDGYSLDRKNNDGNYEPGNIRWASAKEQQNNKGCKNVAL